MTNTKYTTLEQSKRLKEIGFEAEADLWYDPEYPDVPMTAYNGNGVSVIDGIVYEEDAGCGCCGDYKIRTNLISAYRLDTLLGHVKYPAHELQTALCRLDIVAAIAAAVDLLVLLKEVEDNA